MQGVEPLLLAGINEAESGLVGTLLLPSFGVSGAQRETKLLLPPCCKKAVWDSSLVPPSLVTVSSGGNWSYIPMQRHKAMQVGDLLLPEGCEWGQGQYVNFNFTSLIQGSVSQNPTFAKVVTLDLAGSWTNIPIWLSRFISTRGMCAKKKKRLNRIQSLTV